jgi:hypothetical protein
MQSVVMLNVIIVNVMAPFEGSIHPLMIKDELNEPERGKIMTKPVEG